MGRVQPQRGEDGPHLGAIKILHPEAVGAGEFREGEKADAVFGQGGAQFLPPAFVLAFDQLADAADHSAEGLRGGHAVGGAFHHVAFHLLLEAGDAHLEELVQVGTENAEELHPFQQGSGGVQRLFQDAMVELQPAQLAVDEMFRLQCC